MNLTGLRINKILFNFYNLSRDTQKKELTVNPHEVQLRIKNYKILKSFFICIEVCFENTEARNEYTTAVKNYFTALNETPVDGLVALISINALQSSFEKLINNPTYEMFLKILDEYENELYPAAVK